MQKPALVAVLLLLAPLNLIDNVVAFGRSGVPTLTSAPHGEVLVTSRDFDHQSSANLRSLPLSAVSADYIFWFRQLAAPAWAAAADASGVYVAGSFLQKYDVEGNVIWSRQFGSVRAIAVTASGVYVAGGTSSDGGTDAFLQKYDVEGNVIWTRQFGTPAHDGVQAIAVTASGVYVAGQTDGTFPDQTSAGGTDAFLQKYDVEGNVIWTRQFGSSDRDEALAAAVNASGIYVAGFTLGTFPDQTSAGGTDAFLQKYDVEGNVIWTRQFATPLHDFAFALVAHASGVYVAGHTLGTLDGQTRVGLADAFLQKYDVEGNVIWSRQFGTQGWDQARGLAVDGSGLYVAGETDGTFSDQTSAGGTDAFVRMYDLDGNEGRTRQFGTADPDQAYAAAAEASGIYVAGARFLARLRKTLVAGPSAPRALVGIPGDGQATLKWQSPASDGGLPITNYIIYRGTTTGGAAYLRTVGNVLTYTDTGLMNGETYYYQISAVSEAGEGSRSEEARVVPRRSLPSHPWLMFHQNVRRTGLSPFSTATNVGRLAWNFATEGLAYNSPAVAADGAVYVGTTDGHLLAIEPDGSLRWNLDVGSPIYSSPALGTDGTIYVGSGKSLYAVEVDRTVRWSYEIFGGAFDRIESSPAISSDGTIYIGSHADRLYAINPDGTLRWWFATALDVTSSPAIGEDGTIYVGSQDGYLYAVEPDGTVRWRFQTSGQVFSSSPSIGADGTLYIGSGRDLYAVNPDGTPRWTFGTGSGIDSSPGIGPDGTIYVGSGDYNVYAVNADGSQRWVFPTGSRVESSPAIGADGTIFVGSWDGHLYAIRPDGTLRWKFLTGTIYRSSPAIGADGTVYVGSVSGLYAIGGVSLAPSAPQMLAATAGNGQVTLVWAPPDDDGGSPVTGYALYRGTSSGTETLLAMIGNVMEYTDTDLTNGIRYYYQVAAVNAAGEGPRSNEVSTIPNSPPAASFNVSPSRGNLTTVFILDASSSSDDEDPSSALEVRWDWEDDGTWDTGWLTTKTAQHRYDALDMHTVRLEVKDTQGWTDTTTRAVEVRDELPPSVSIDSPTDNEAIAGTPILVRGTAADAGGSGLQRVEVRVNGGSWTTAAGTATWNLSLDLTLGSNLIEAQAWDSAGNPSTHAAVTVIFDNVRPTVISCTVDPTSVEVGGSVTVTATATDNPGGAGVRSYLITVNTGEAAVKTFDPSDGSETFTLDEAGDYTVECVANDRVGQASEARTAALRVTARPSDNALLWILFIPVAGAAAGLLLFFGMKRRKKPTEAPPGEPSNPPVAPAEPPGRPPGFDWP